MQDYKIEHPTLADVPLIKSLMAEDVKRGVLLERSEDEIANAIRSFFIIRESKIQADKKISYTPIKLASLDSDRIIGMCSLYIYSKTLGEIRSLIIDNVYRGKGLATALIQRIKTEAKNLGLKELLVLTYNVSLFERNGFVIIDKSLLPNQKIWADCIKCKHFPICDEIALLSKI